MFGLQFVNYGARILHSTDIDDMQEAILCDGGNTISGQSKDEPRDDAQSDATLVALPPRSSAA